jgi:hypothetical protein
VKEVKKALINYLYPDKARDLIEGLQYGYELKYSGPRRLFAAKSKEIVGYYEDIAKQKIMKEIQLGRIAGPFSNPPFPIFRVSPISVIPKKIEFGISFNS